MYKIKTQYKNYFLSWWFKTDFTILFATICLMLLGLFVIATVSSYIARSLGVSDAYFVKKQSLYIIISVSIIILISTFNEIQIKKFAILGFIFCMLLLIYTNYFGVEVKGAKRWMKILFLRIQPSELMKPFIIIIHAHLFSLIYYTKQIKFFIISVILYAVCVLLIIFQPDIGMSLNISIVWIGQLFIAGISFILLAMICLAGLLCIIISYFYFPHVAQRIDNFFFHQKSGDNYQITKALEALQSGGLSGQGILSSKFVKYLPDSHTDFILASIGEELGFIAITIILFTYLFIILKGLKLSYCSRNIFQKFVTAGLIIQLATQIMINIGVNTYLLPTKGTTLPFLSYGGSSLLSFSIIIGVLLASSKYKEPKKIKAIIDY